MKTIQRLMVMISLITLFRWAWITRAGWEINRTIKQSI